MKKLYVFQVCYASKSGDEHSKGCKDKSERGNSKENMTVCDDSGCEYWCSQDLCNNRNFTGKIYIF